MEKNNYNYELVQDQYPHFYLAQGRDHCCSMHFHRKVELLYVTKRTKRVIVNNAPYVLQQDNLCIIDSYSLHYYEPSDGEQTVVTLTTASCENFFKHRSNKTLCGNVIDDRDYCRTRVRPYLDNLFDYAKMDAYSVQANVDMLLSGICARIGLKKSAEPFEIENMDAILAYIEKNYNKDLPLSALAAHFGYSKYYFSRLFNNIFHTSINDYLSIIRLEKTLQYLHSHNCSITTAALNNGFNSMPTFYRVLKKFHTGQPKAAKPPREE